MTAFAGTQNRDICNELVHHPAHRGDTTPGIAADPWPPGREFRRSRFLLHSTQELNGIGDLAQFGLLNSEIGGHN